MVFYLPYKSIRHTKLDERKIIIFNQSIENYIADELLEIDYWRSVCTKSLYFILFLAIFLFIGLSIEYLCLLKIEKMVLSSILEQKDNKQNIANFFSVNSVLVLTYEQRQEEEFMYLYKKTNDYSVLANIQMQLEMDNHEMIKQFQDQEQYIKDMMSIILSNMTYQKILQGKSTVTLKIDIKNKINKFLSRGKVRDIHNINIMYL